MDQPDPVIAALLGGVATADAVEAARRHLLMLTSLEEEVRSTAPALTPPSAGSWRSIAADRYIDGLDDLRARIFFTRELLAEAAHALRRRIARMEAQLEELQSTDASR